MKIRAMKSELFHTEGCRHRQIDRQTEMTQLIVASHVVANAPKYWLFQHVYFPVYNRLYFCYMQAMLWPYSYSVQKALIYQLNFTVFMYVTRISRYIYSIRYYPRVHVNAVGLGTITRGYTGTTVFMHVI
jgi:hypothetical protein